MSIKLIYRTSVLLASERAKFSLREFLVLSETKNSYVIYSDCIEHESEEELEDLIKAYKNSELKHYTRTKKKVSMEEIDSKLVPLAFSGYIFFDDIIKLKEMEDKLLAKLESDFNILQEQLITVEINLNKFKRNK